MLMTNPRRTIRSHAGAIQSRARLAVAVLASAGFLVASGCAEKPTDKTGPSQSAPVGTPGQAGDPTLPEELEPKHAADPTGPQDAGAPDAPWEGPWFVVTRVAAAVYSEPEFEKKKKLGYVRSGGHVPVEKKTVSKKNCSSGWYKLAGHGHICGNLGTTALGHPQVKFATRQPDLERVLPYQYARNAKHGTPLYKSVPSREQMLSYEPYLAKKDKQKTDKDNREEKDSKDKQQPSQAGAPSGGGCPSAGGPRRGACLPSPRGGSASIAAGLCRWSGGPPSRS